ncbi:MAG: LysM peptidoglycan-binding domain-containing protein [Lachnospiraceae bacterium]|nr:LysM peptidoglycan-binding domain-containing protein [Lachnospiraceae bacterium]
MSISVGKKIMKTVAFGLSGVLLASVLIMTGSCGLYRNAQTIQAREVISCYITFRVENGEWNDGTTADKVVRLWRYDDEDLALLLDAGDIPAVGNRPGEGYMAGRWDVTPTTDLVITHDYEYTYSYISDPDYGNEDAEGDLAASENKKEYIDELRKMIEDAISDGGEQTIIWSEGTSIPYDILLLLKDHPGITLIFSCSYQNVDFRFTITGDMFREEENISWCGPFYLYAYYGSRESVLNPLSAAELDHTYTATAGDTLAGIAIRLGVSLESLEQLNGLDKDAPIPEGTVIRF